MIRTHSCKIRMGNLKSQIDLDYFKYRDIFYRVLVLNLGVYNLTMEEIRSTTIVEDAHYNQMFSTVIDGSPTIEYLMRDVDSVEVSLVLVDVNLYLESFLRKHHNHNTTNIYSISIEDDYTLKITNKKVSKGKLVYRSDYVK